MFIGICVRVLAPRTRTPAFQHIRTLATQSAKLEEARMSKYSTVQRGCRNSLSYKLYLKNENGVVISPFHDIPLYTNEKNVLNMIVEIPRWTNGKMEMATTDPMNPIKQDVKKGKLRFVANVFPHHGYIWNYGAFPQTWEDPTYTEPETNTNGDNDPLDVLEIGSVIHPTGAVIQVKVIGIMCLIDEGETDWKVIVIDVTDPRAKQLNNVEDLDTHCPGLLKETYKWFKLYKKPDGKPENTFAFAGKAKNKEYADKIIAATHDQWQRLLQNKITNTKDLACHNTTVMGSPYTISPIEANAAVEASAAPGPSEPLPEKGSC